jgi:hypothetical protein
VVAVTSLSREVCLGSGMDHRIGKPQRPGTLPAECEQLGLIPRPGTAPGQGAGVTGRARRRLCAGTRIVGLTAADGPDAYLAMLRAGASGLLVKGGSAERLVEMIHRARTTPTD